MRTTIAGDFHIPYQDTALVNKWLGHIQKTKPDRVILNGDLMDAGMLSKFDKVPGIDQSFSSEIELTKTFLRSVRKATDSAEGNAQQLIDFGHGLKNESISKTEIVFVIGNHDFRLKKYLVAVAPELIDLKALDLESLLELEDLDIELIDIPDQYATYQDNYFENQDFLVGHFNMARTGIGATAKGLMEKYGKNILQSHVHRIAMLAKWQYDKQIIGVEGGCMCNLNNNYRKNANWQQGWVDLIDNEVELHAMI